MSETDHSEGPGKGKPFFARAAAFVEAGNYDYAIDLFIEGLRCEPHLAPHHEALREIALRRKMAGSGKATGVTGAFSPVSGDAPKDRMLYAERLLASDPDDVPEMLNMMRAAAAGKYYEVVLWFAPIAASASKSAKKSRDGVFGEIISLLESLDHPGGKILANTLKKIH
jgi:hypothetical protein